jgi:hypothetical protein
MNSIEALRQRFAPHVVDDTAINQSNERRAKLQVCCEWVALETDRWSMIDREHSCCIERKAYVQRLREQGLPCSCPSSLMNEGYGLAGNDGIHSE